MQLGHTRKDPYLSIEESSTVQEEGEEKCLKVSEGVGRNVNVGLKGYTL